MANGATQRPVPQRGWENEKQGGSSNPAGGHGDKPMVAEAVGVADFGDTEDTTIALWNGLVPVAEGIEGKRVALLAESTKVRRVSR